MQRKHIFLSLIGPGPKYPGKNINVYMQPLIDDLKEAWVNGIRTYDAVSKKTSQCMFGTSTHFMTYGRIHFSWGGLCMGGSHAQGARQACSPVGCSMVASILASIFIDNICALTIHSEKTRRTS